MGGDAVLKPYVSGEDYLETVLILQNKKVWYATLILSGIWGMPNTVSVMQWMFYVMGDLTMYADSYRPLTIVECERAETVFERHQFFTNQFVIRRLMERMKMERMEKVLPYQSVNMVCWYFWYNIPVGYVVKNKFLKSLVWR